MGNIKKDDDGDDIWDDTALIKAYDSAIKAMKTKIGGVCDTEPTVSNNQEESKKKQHKKKWKTRKGLAQRQTHPQWKIGDTCTARFSEDGQMYDAVILSINKPDQTCLVQYVDYGNEETQALSALLQVASLHGKSNCRLPNDSHVASDNDSMDMSPRGAMSPRGSSPRSTPSPCPSRGRSSLRGTPRPRFPGGRGGHSPFNAWSNPPAMPPFMPPMMGAPFSMPTWPGPPTPPRMPQMPPPPPPPMVDEDMMESDSEALYSMLIAWYMSGYHTGYYQGLKQGRKQGKTDKT
ncbi:hypothetical protein NP493_692g07004 [Ridgeia piscesae]|uniref:Tudor domain-containing protein n=1 Tax=Ridgeia piscesae TaxID=27915 RepID=A0AAD9KR53_RIDPI|nr:hypothetical protein NP493_692g07004 [Ridgeia piscesae]